MMKKKQLSKAQLWARQRNSAKFRICGLLANIEKMIYDNAILTGSECFALAKSAECLSTVKDSWKSSNEQSKLLFLGGKSS